MIVTWFSIFAVIAGLVFLITIVVIAGMYLYKNRPKPPKSTYFWDEG